MGQQLLVPLSWLDKDESKNYFLTKSGGKEPPTSSCVRLIQTVLTLVNAETTVEVKEMNKKEKIKGKHAIHGLLKDFSGQHALLHHS